MPKTIVITGTATGMGRATVSKFACEGWNVVATVRKESDLKSSRRSPLGEDHAPERVPEHRAR
jgi:NAD(P)-dependent dehydrogenase (short-subunit alcohol dehydrogenase family)